MTHMVETENRISQTDVPQAEGAPEELLDRLIRQAKEETPVDSSSTGQPTASPLSGILGGLMSNPALLQALPQLMSSWGQLSAVGRKSDGGDGARSVSVSAHGGHRDVDRHIALLCAIKPYLCKDRQQAAEYMIILCRMWNTLQSMGISLPMLTTALSGHSVSSVGEEGEVKEHV